MKYLIVIILALLTTRVKAETDLLYFHSTWCPNCPRASKLLKEPESLGYLVKFDQALGIDIDKFPDWTKYFKITSIPTVLIVDHTGNQWKILDTWQPTLSDDESRGRLREILKKFVPKRLQKSNFSVK